MKDTSQLSWSAAELGDLVAVCRPRSDPRDYPDMPFIGMDNVEAHTMRLLGTVPAGTMKSNATHFRTGDVLYGRLRPYLNKVLAPSFEGLASAEFIPLTPEAGIDHDFIRYRLNAADFVSFTSHLDEGDRPRVDWDGIRRFKVSLPPSAEQRRIVEAIDSYLTRLDDAVASLERVQAKLKAYRASVLKAAVEGRLVPTEAALSRAEKREYEPAGALLARILKERRRRWEDAELAKFKAAVKTPKDDKWKTKYRQPAAPDTKHLPPLPEGWTWASADQVTFRITDGEHVTPPRTESGVLLLSARNVGQGQLRLEDVDYVSEKTHGELCKRLTIEAGDVLLSCSGTVGRTCAVPQNIRFSLVRSVAVLKPLVIRSDYLTWAMASPFLQMQIHRRKTQTAQANIFQGQIKKLVLPVPPLAEQERLLDVVPERLDVAERQHREVLATQARLRRLRQAILKWAFEGKLVDQEPSDEPAHRLLAHIRAERVDSVSNPKTRGRKTKKTA